MTAFVAAEVPGGVNYDIGALYGASLFVTTLIVGCIILVTKR